MVMMGPRKTTRVLYCGLDKPRLSYWNASHRQTTDEFVKGGGVVFVECVNGDKYRWRKWATRVETGAEF